jgi:hypothetical protein
MERVIAELVDLAIKHKINVDAPHHMRKGAHEPGDADAGRGGSAVKDGGRLVFTLTAMSDQEAKQFGIAPENRRQFVRMDHAKVNLAPSGKTRWFELIGVKLNNATELYPKGDEIQVATTWSPPETWAGVTDDVTNAILDDIGKGLDDGRLYSKAGAAKETAAWKVAKRHCPDKTEPQCREIINQYVKTEMLCEDEYTNPVAREAAKGLRVKAANRPRGFV